MTNSESTNLENFFWFNEPDEFLLTEKRLTIRTNQKTDFWQNTHYGFQRDDGHCLFKNISGDFSIQAETQFDPKAQYDQCGLFARIDKDNWIKCSTEYENSQLSRLGSVVTNLGYSDWASQNIYDTVTSMWYRLTRTGDDFLIENSYNGIEWFQMRVTHLHNSKETIDVGLYACSPIGDGFHCSFENIAIGDTHWHGE